MRWLRRQDEEPGDEQDQPVEAAGTVEEDLFQPAPAGRVPTPDPPPESLTRLDPVEVERALRRTVARALAEDLGADGDVTTLACVPPGARGRAFVVARQGGIIAGTDALVETYAQVDPRVDVEVFVRDGQPVQAGAEVARVEGPLRALLTGERTALNLLCRLAGIATLTRSFVALAEGTGAHVRDTRKTSPGLRLLEKAAVVAGGGSNHRVGLHDALLVKDNHVAVAGSVAAAVQGALERANGRHVQVEVQSLVDVDEALAAGARDLLLDNFTVDEAREAVARVDGRAGLEVSGRITLDNVRDYAETGVDRIAIGALTHSAPALDLGLDVDVGSVDLVDLLGVRRRPEPVEQEADVPAAVVAPGPGPAVTPGAEATPPEEPEPAPPAAWAPEAWSEAQAESQAPADAAPEADQEARADVEPAAAGTHDIVDDWDVPANRRWSEDDPWAPDERDEPWSPGAPDEAAEPPPEDPVAVDTGAAEEAGDTTAAHELPDAEETVAPEAAGAGNTGLRELLAEDDRLRSLLGEDEDDEDLDRPDDDLLFGSH